MELGPTAPIVGAVAGALMTAAVSYFFVFKRRRVTFWVRPAMNLSGLLRPFVKMLMNGVEIDALYRAEVVVVNSGNTSIKDVGFEIRVPGQHQHCLAQAEAADSLLANSEGRKNLLLWFRNTGKNRSPVL